MDKPVDTATDDKNGRSLIPVVFNFILHELAKAKAKWEVLASLRCFISEILSLN